MNINLEYGRVFEETFEAVQSGKYRIVINRGGTRSGKTFALAQYFISLLFTITDKPVILSCVRKTMPVHRQGAMRDIISILQDTGLYSLVTHNKTYNTITFTQGDITNTLEFFSVEEEQKVRGPGRTHLWINEANELSFDEYRQLSLRTTGVVFIDFNPDDEEVWINKELEQDRAVREGYQDVKVIVSSYKDNPFLSEAIIKDIELLKDTDAEYWQIFGLGEYGKITGLIFTNYAICTDIPQGAKLIGYGLDFGFTNDPTACVAVYMQDGELWVKEILYEKGLTNPDIKRMLNERGIGDRETIIADSAEPKSIEELKRMGFVFIEGARKGADSINASIDALKRYKINITVDSANLISEIKKYKWKIDRNGVNTGVPVDMFNHCFVGSTKISTKDGEKCIDKIKAGDLVNTREGIKKVVDVHKNTSKVYKYSISNSIYSLSLECTENHYISTLKGWKEIRKIKAGDYIWLHKSSMEKSTTCTKEKDTFQKEQNECTSRYGDFTMAIFLKAIMYTIKTAILTITTLIILKWFGGLTTFQSTLKNIIKTTGITFWKTLTKYGLLQKIGTHRMKVLSGTDSTQKTQTLENLICLKNHVNNVEAYLNQKRIIVNSAQIIVSRLLDEVCELIMKGGSVWFAHGLSRLANTHQPKLVPLRVRELSRQETGIKEVYDLTVDGAHEYIANGIVVHNCVDALRYLALNKIQITPVRGGIMKIQRG